MRIAIVEDDEKDMAQLKGVLGAYAADHGLTFAIEAFSSGEEFLRAFAPKKYTLVFFDNYIGTGLGIDLARKARALDADAEFVFVSMSMEFALSGYEVRALHYLIKPATLAEIEKVFERLRRTAPKPEESMIEVICDYHPVLIPADSIRYIEVVDKACIIHGKEDVKTYTRLGALLELLPPGDFVRPHRSFAVRLACIQSMSRYEFVLKGGGKVPISQTYHDDCKRAYIEYRAHSQKKQ
ncbi:MAG: response regulator transcription factor [Schwartzia sp.]|nr:response regulator transcription factor [Schwartzia sp. (in: firmicutes)]